MVHIICISLRIKSVKSINVFIMKKIIFLLVIIAFTSCTKKDDVILHITDSQWYLTNNNYGSGDVHLKISGSTNGDEVLISLSRNSGISLLLDSKKNFNSDIVINFFATVPGGEFEMSTRVMAIKGSDTLSVPLNSGKLKF